MRKKVVDIVVITLGLLLFVSFFAFPLFRFLFPVPERPMFSAGYLHEGLASHWAPPVLFGDEVGNQCAMDEEMNSVLICLLKGSSNTVVVFPLAYQGFNVSMRPDFTDQSLLQSKSLHFEGRKDTLYIISDDLTFTIARLRPGAAKAMKEARTKWGIKVGKHLDWIARVQDFVVKDADPVGSKK